MTDHSALTKRLIDDGLKPRQEAAAYERLRDAAPELLRAAQRALRVLRAQGESVRPGNVLGELDAAISKATGQTQDRAA